MDQSPIVDAPAASKRPARPRRRWLRRAATTLAVVGLIGLVVIYLMRPEIGARMLISAPHPRQIVMPATTPELLDQCGVNHTLRVEVGPPAATLAVWVIDPPASPPAAIRGTILFLHGIQDNKLAMVPSARAAAARGYRAVVVDSRGHGESSAGYATFGGHEVRDYQQLLDALQQRGLLAGRIGVYGASYGGGIAAQLAGRDERIAAAVALAPFQSLRRIAHDRAQSLGLSWFFDPATVEAALRRVEQITGARVDEADGVAALARRQPPLLVLHGTRDRVVPPEHGAALAAATSLSRLILIPDATHYNWTAPGRETVGAETAAWFDRWLAPAD